jgi:hypothetical protein
LFVSLSNERVRCCGCKSSELIELNKPFLNLFLKYFLNHWLVGFYKCDFLKICDFKGVVFDDFIGFEGVWIYLGRG